MNDTQVLQAIITLQRRLSLIETISGIQGPKGDQGVTGAQGPTGIPGVGVLLTDGTTTFQFNVRNGALCIDQTLTPTGFAGNESLDNGVTGDWITLTSFKQLPV